MRPTSALLLAFVATLLALTVTTRIITPIETTHLTPRQAGIKLDLNTADAATLSLLPGVGPGLGQRIVDDRQSHGPFTSVDELGRVSGIGEKTAARVRPYVFCGGAMNDRIIK